MTSSSKPNKKKKIFFACLIATLCIHLSALFLFYTHPVFIYPYLGSILARAMPSRLLGPDPEEIAEVEHSEQLEDFFKEIIPLDQIPYDLAKLPTKESGLPHEEIPQKLGSIFEDEEIQAPILPDNISIAPDFTLPSLPSAPLIPPENDVPFLSTAIELDKSSSIEFLEGLVTAPESTELNEEMADVLAGSKQPEILFSPENGLALLRNPEAFARQKKEVPQLKITDDAFLALQGNEINLRQAPAPSSDLLLPVIPDHLEIAERRSLLKGGLYSAEYYGLPEEDAPIDWNNDFDVQVAVMPDEQTGKYVFSVALVPNFDKSTEKMKQNLSFIIDRSSSIEKHRFTVFKRATLKALASMKENDTFNIFVFDRKVVQFSDKNLPISKKTLQLAEDFLNTQEQNNFFSSSDLQSSLEKILPSSGLSDDEFNTTILLSDGKALLKSHKQQKAISKWVKNNKGKVALFSAAVGQGNNLFLLDLLGTFSGGNLLYSDTYASFPRKLAKLILDLQEPIAKEIVITAIPSAGKPEITFYPSSLPFSALYNRKPYVIVGTIDKLSDFTLVVQAKNKDQLYTIKKEISFQGAKKGGSSLEKQWAVQQANLLYEDYLDDGKAAHLKEAKEILTPHSSFVAQK